MRGGKRPGAGRKPGVRNKRTTEMMEKAAATAEKIGQVLGASSFDGDAHALMMSIYKDTSLPIELRLDAAGKAAPYEKPRLANIDQKLSGNVGYSAIQVAERDAFDPMDAAARPAGSGDPKASRH